MHKAEKLILGTVQFGLHYGINNQSGRVKEDDAVIIMKVACKAGIKTFDTARAYGQAEMIIGKFIQQDQPANLKVITKFHLHDDNDWEAALEESLRHLRLEKVDTLLFHSFAAYLEHKDQLEDMLQAHKGIKFNRIGVSVYTNDELAALLDEEKIEVVQVPFNLLDNHSKRGKLLQQLKDKDKTIMTRSVFLQGLFFKDPVDFPEGLVALSQDAQKIHTLADEAEIPVGALALQYALSKTYIDGVLFGVDSLTQLETNLNWLELDVSKNTFESVDSVNVIHESLLNPSTWQL